MARVSLTKHGSQVRQIMNAVRQIPQADIANEICESQQTVSYRLKNVYPQALEDMITILDMAGYEIKEKGC